MSDNDNDTISTAVIAERLNAVISGHSRLEDLIQKIISTNQELASQVGAMHQYMQHNDEKTKRLFDIVDVHTTKLAKQESKINSHSLIWKTVGAALIASFGLVGWGWNLLQQQSKFNGDADRRLSVIEFIVNREHNAQLTRGAQQ